MGGLGRALAPLQPPQEVPPPRQPQALGTFQPPLYSGLPLSLVTCTWLPPQLPVLCLAKRPHPQAHSPSRLVQQVPASGFCSWQVGAGTRGVPPRLLSPAGVEGSPVWCVRGPRPPSSSAGLPSWLSGHLPCAPHCPVPGVGLALGQGGNQGRQVSALPRVIVLCREAAMNQILLHNVEKVITSHVYITNREQKQ